MTDVTMNAKNTNNVNNAAEVKNGRKVARNSIFDKQNHPGMASVAIAPGTPEFNRFLTARAGAAIRGFNDVSIAISTLFRTVDAIKHGELVKAIQDWFDTLHEENDQMRKKLEVYIASIKVDEDDAFLSSLQYTPYKYDSVQLNFNNPNTMRFYKYIHDMNNHLAMMSKYNALGLLAVSDYNVMSHNIIKSISMYVERVKRTLQVSRRTDGPYSPEDFISKVMQYKSVQAYIDAELSHKGR